MSFDTTWLMAQLPNIHVKIVYGAVDDKITRSLFDNKYIVLFIIIVILVLIFYLIRLHIKSVYRQAEIKSQIKQFGNCIVTQQFNPHFLFNSLNAIHHFVLTNNVTESSKYLLKFSTLIRNVTESSEREYVTIEDEIASLNLYVELEQLRFPDKFSLKINISDNIERNNTLIMPFIIQPLVENAIRHGVVQSEKKGDILVDIKKNSGFLMIVVEDNGIGRIEAAKLAINLNKNSMKMGTSILFQRIKHYNSINKHKISINIVDLYNNSGIATGTRVVMLLPLFNKTRV